MNVIEAEVNGTLDILRTCSQAKSVRRVIYTSSITAASPLNDDGEFRDCLDESCWTPIDIMRREKPIFWVSSLLLLTSNFCIKRSVSLF